MFVRGIDLDRFNVAVFVIAVKDWAKTLSDHVDPYHLGIRFVGFLTAILF